MNLKNIGPGDFEKNRSVDDGQLKKMKNQENNSKSHENQSETMKNHESILRNDKKRQPKKTALFVQDGFP